MRVFFCFHLAKILHLIYTGSMIRKYVIQQAIGIVPQASIGHHGSIHWRIFFMTLLSLGLCLVVYTFLAKRSTHAWISRGAGIAWWLIYIYFILQFLNNYLDALVITPQFLGLFQRDGVLEYHMQQCERDKIEMMSYTQNSLRDKILSRGDVLITLDHSISFSFDNVGSPKRVVNALWAAKATYSDPSSDDSDEEWLSDNNNEKFEILVETLGEVIKDYMHKKY